MTVKIVANARQIALEALLRVEQDSAYSNIVLGSIFSENNCSKEDKALASAIFYGVLDRQITIDFFINKSSKIKTKKMEPITRNVLRLSVFQIKFMDKIPKSAAVNEGVKLLKNTAEERNSGFVNAVLRSICETENLLPDGNDLYSISIKYSCPQWILGDLVKDYGIEKTKEILNSFLHSSKVFLRVNTIKNSTEELKEKLINSGISVNDTVITDCLEVVGGIDFSGNMLFKEGLFHVQDVSSQKCAAAVSPIKGERILDICAAPGGKSFTMAQIMGNIGEIVSCDLYENRVSLIKSGAKRLGLSIINAKQNDATVYNEKLGEFDAVLCDVPCSGFGVIGRKPEIKYKKADDFDSLKEIQQKIIRNASQHVKSGGRLLYSTCTLRKAENEDVVNEFIKENNDFALKFMETDIPSENCDGFFKALLIRK